MLAPVSDQIAQEFGITSTVLIAMITSIFLLAYGASSVFRIMPLLYQSDSD